LGVFPGRGNEYRVNPLIITFWDRQKKKLGILSDNVPLTAIGILFVSWKMFLGNVQLFHSSYPERAFAAIVERTRSGEIKRKLLAHLLDDAGSERSPRPALTH